jgi:DNA repair exonuclease SbcCD ATPase subunit
MIDQGAVTPFDSKESLPNLIRHLSGLVAIPLELNDIREFLTESEYIFQKIVSNAVPTQHYEQLMNLRLWDVKHTLPFLTQLRHSHALELQNQQLEQTNQQIENHRLSALSEIEHLRIQLESSQRAYDALRKEANRQIRTITSLRNQTEGLRRSFSFRIGNSIIRPLAVLKRLLKRSK